MPYAPCKFIKRIAEFQERAERKHVPDNTRGIYVLLKKTGRDEFEVVYIGMSGRGKISGIYARLDEHSKNKNKKWTHFTLFEAHDNLTNAEIKELEGLILCVYRKDLRVNKHNIQFRYKPFRQVSEKISKWTECE